MPGPKIQDEQEVLRWFREGKTYQEMSDIYRKKYNITMTPSGWGNFRRRRGLEHRIARNTDLIPWKIKPAHRLAYAVVMLRNEARRVEGLPLTENAAKRLASWKEMLTELRAVVHYDPDTEEGFFYVRRVEGDEEFIRPLKNKALAGRPRRD